MKNTFLQTLCFVLITFGGVFLAVAAVRYHDFVRYSFSENYNRAGKNKVLLIFIRAGLVLFTIGYVLETLGIFSRDAELAWMLGGIVFFACSLFIVVMIRVQMSMTIALRNKTMEVMRAFINSVEQKDFSIKGHSWHVYNIAILMYEELPPPIKARINRPKLLDAALLHDIGKIGIAEDILNKPGKLTDAEWEIMRTHPITGKKMLENTCFSEISDWVMYHHERVDGTGYYRLPGNRVPIEARLIAVADTYAALMTERTYHFKLDHSEAIRILRDVAGRQLDTALVKYFCRIPKAKLEQALATGTSAYLEKLSANIHSAA